ncbi:hypothetical protein [Phaeobacter sp. JH204B]
MNDLVSGAHDPIGIADALAEAIMIKDPVHAGIVLRSLADVPDPEGA